MNNIIRLQSRIKGIHVRNRLKKNNIRNIENERNLNQTNMRLIVIIFSKNKEIIFYLGNISNFKPF